MSMPCQENFYAGEDLETILEAIDEEILDKDVEFTAKVHVLVREIEEPLKIEFKCEKCGKLCKFKQSLSRHQNSKQRKFQPEQEGGTSTVAENYLNTACLTDCINHCAKFFR